MEGRCWRRQVVPCREGNYLHICVVRKSRTSRLCSVMTCASRASCRWAEKYNLHYTNLTAVVSIWNAILIPSLRHGNTASEVNRPPDANNLNRSTIADRRLQRPLEEFQTAIVECYKSVTRCQHALIGKYFDDAEKPMWKNPGVSFPHRDHYLLAYWYLMF